MILEISNKIFLCNFLSIAIDFVIDLQIIIVVIYMKIIDT